MRGFHVARPSTAKNVYTPTQCSHFSQSFVNLPPSYLLLSPGDSLLAFFCRETVDTVTLITTMSVVGIDFGYQNSVIAAAGRGGVDVILNGNSNRLNPYVKRVVFVCVDSV